MELINIIKDKIDVFLKETIYIWEILFSIIGTICLYQVIYLEHSVGGIHKKFLLVAILCLAIIIFVIIKTLKKNKDKLENIFVSFIIPIGILYMIFMLPTYAPDEIQHIWRIYEISQGNILTRQDEQGYCLGIDVPDTLIDMQHTNLKKYSELNNLLIKDTNYSQTTNVVSPAKCYPFVFYLPATVIMFLAIHINLPLIFAIYIAKFINFIIFVTMGYFVIKKAPFGKYVFFTILFLPMVIQQAVSLSLDAMINVVIYTYIVFTMNLVFKKCKINTKEKIIYIILTILVSLAKMIYIPIIGLGFMLIFSRNLSKKDKIFLIGFGTLICMSLVLMNYMYTAGLKIEGTQAKNERAVEQVEYIVKNPLKFIEMIVNTLRVNGGYYIDTMIGSELGWLDIKNDQLVIRGFLIMLFLSCFLDKNEENFSKKQKIWICLIFIGTILLLITMTYVLWTQVGAKTPFGIQGRYFLPILPLILLPLISKESNIKFNKKEIILPVIFAIFNICTLDIVIKFFI